MMASASAIGAVSVYAGLLASYHFNLAAGASITLVATVLFAGAFSAVRILGLRKRPAPAAPAEGVL